MVLLDIPLGTVQDSGALGQGWGCWTSLGKGTGEQEKVTSSWALPGLCGTGTGAAPALQRWQQRLREHWGLRAVKCRWKL